MLHLNRISSLAMISLPGAATYSHTKFKWAWEAVLECAAIICEIRAKSARALQASGFYPSKIRPETEEKISDKDMSTKPVFSRLGLTLYAVLRNSACSRACLTAQGQTVRLFSGSWASDFYGRRQAIRNFSPRRNRGRWTRI